MRECAGKLKMKGHRAMVEQAKKEIHSKMPGRDDDESFLSLREILQMVLRHKGKIVAATLVVTIAAGGFFLLQPRKYQAEGMFQVMPLVRTTEKADRDMFETSILSHLEYIKSPLVSVRVKNTLAKQNIVMDGNELRKSVNIQRPPKTSLIRVVASANTPETAINIAQFWMDEYMLVVKYSNIQRALFQVRSMINDSFDKGLEKMARAEEMRIQAEKVQNDRLITVSRSVDDTELWKKLMESVDDATLKRLSGIQLKSQEVNDEYLLVKNVLLSAEQEARSTLSRRDFYNQIIVLLEARSKQPLDVNRKEPDATNSTNETEIYVQTLLNTRDIVSLGKAELLSDSRGALKKTAIAFVIALFASCMLAFIAEWLKEDG